MQVSTVGSLKVSLKMKESILGIRIHAVGKLEQYRVEKAGAESEGLTTRPEEKNIRDSYAHLENTL